MKTLVKVLLILFIILAGSLTPILVGFIYGVVGIRPTGSSNWPFLLPFVVWFFGIRWVMKTPLLNSPPDPLMNSADLLALEQGSYLVLHSGTNQQYGPVTGIVVKDWIKRNRIAPHDLIKQSDAEKWTPLKESQFASFL